MGKCNSPTFLLSKVILTIISLNSLIAKNRRYKRSSCREEILAPMTYRDGTIVPTAPTHSTYTDKMETHRKDILTVTHTDGYYIEGRKCSCQVIRDQERVFNEHQFAIHCAQEVFVTYTPCLPWSPCL